MARNSIHTTLEVVTMSILSHLSPSVVTAAFDADGGDVEADLDRRWLNRTLGFLGSIQSNRPIPPAIFCLIKTTNIMSSAQEQAAAARGGGGRRVGNPNWSRDETMHMLSIVQQLLPIGAEQWDAVVAEHSNEYPGRCKNGIMRKYTALHRKGIPTGDPNCPEDVRLAKRIKYELGNKAAVGDAEEEFVIREVAHGVSGANPNPQPNQEPNDQEPTAGASQPTESTGVAGASASVVPASASKKRGYRNSSEGAAAKKDEFIEMFRMQMLQQQHNAEMDRQQRREDDRARERIEQSRVEAQEKLQQSRIEAQERNHQQMMQMIGASLGTISSIWKSGNTAASVVFRNGQDAVYEGVLGSDGEEEQELTDGKEYEGVFLPKPYPESPPRRKSPRKSTKDKDETPPKRSRRNRK
jgi:hypothetical protein